MELLDNIFIHTTAEDFGGSKHSTESVRVGDGAIELGLVGRPYPAVGTYTSEVIHTQPFRNLIMSWNADTPTGTHIELEARVLLTGGIWSEWMSWGKWGRTIVSSMAHTSDDHVKVDTDTLIIKGINEEATAVQYRVQLHSQDPEVTPTVRLIAGSMRNDLPGHQLVKLYDGSMLKSDLAVDLPVPQYSQYRRDPQVAHGICSPTCLTMVMEYFGTKVLVEEVVRATWDNAYKGYGNWSFNAAVAASYGFSAYVAYYSGEDDTATLDLIRLELAEGRPIIASVRYRNSSEVDRNLPVLESAPIPSTGGHLVLIRGIVEREGVNFLIVNDPAAPDDATVRREYRADQFLAAWSNRVVYIIFPEVGRVKHVSPQHISAKFETTGNKRNNNGVEEFEYVLRDMNGNTVSLSSNDSKHVVSIVYSTEGEPLRYIAPQAEESIWFSDDTVSVGYDFTVLFTAGKVYRTTLI